MSITISWFKEIYSHIKKRNVSLFDKFKDHVKRKITEVIHAGFTVGKLELSLIQSAPSHSLIYVGYHTSSLEVYVDFLTEEVK